MKTTLFYFSGSGNSLKIAEDLGSKLEKAKVVSIPKVIKKKIDVSSDCIGIFFPVYI